MCVLILTLLLTAGMAFFFLSNSSLHASVKHKVAIELANAKLEEVVNMVDMYNGTLPPAIANCGAAGCVEYRYAANTRYLCNLTVGDVETTATHSGPEYKEVRVEATAMINSNSTVADPAEQPANLVTYFKP